MTIHKDKIRKEVHLFQEIIDALQKQADSQNRTLKNHMENILIKEAREVKNEHKRQIYR